MIRAALILIVITSPLMWSALVRVTSSETSPTAVVQLLSQEPRTPADAQIKPESAQVEALLKVVRDKELQSKDAEHVVRAIEQLGHLRSQAAIPDLIELLQFKRVFPWEETDPGVQMHPISPLGRYPAAGALFEIGRPALPALTDVLYSADADSVAIGNAIAAIAAIYERTSPAEGTAFFERVATDPAVRADGAQLQRAAERLRVLVPSKRP